MKKILFFLLIILSFWNINAQNFGFTIIPKQSQSLCLPVASNPTFDIQFSDIDPVTKAPIININGYPTTIINLPINASFRYRLIGANFVSTQTVTLTYPPFYSGPVITTISPFIPLGGIINPGVTTLYIDEIYYNWNFIDFPAAETPRTYDITFDNPVSLNESDYIQGSSTSLIGTDYNYTFNTTLADGVYKFQINTTGSNDNPFLALSEAYLPSPPNPIFTINPNPITDGTVVGGKAFLKISPKYLTNLGMTTLSITGVTKASPICFVNYLVPKSLSFNVVSSSGPDVSGTKSILINPVCQGSNASVTFNSSAIANGNYTIIYTLSNANTLGSTTANVTFSGGSTNFSIPFAQIPNSGNTRISIVSISDGSGTSSYLPTIDFIFTINSRPNASGSNTIN